MLVLNLPFKALMFLTLMRPSLVLFLVLWLKLVKDFLKVRCRLALLPFLISCLIWLDLVAKIGRAVQQECRDRSRMPSSACKKKLAQNIHLTQQYTLFVLHGHSDASRHSASAQVLFALRP